MVLRKAASTEKLIEYHPKNANHLPLKHNPTSVDSELQ
jgi:hypothetical protein